MKHLEETPWFICDKEDENYCAYVDTDSNYFNAEPILKYLYPNFESFSDEEKDEKLEGVALAYQDIITEHYDNLAADCFNVKQFEWFDKPHWLEMKTECVIRSAYFRATRRYAQWITKQEGIATQILDGTIPLAKLGNPTAVKKLDKYSGKSARAGEMFTEILKGAPAPVRAAIRYNDLLRLWQLDRKYNLITMADKGKWIYLKDNPYKIEALAFFDYEMPEKIVDFLDTYADRQKVFDSILLNKLEGFFSDLGWSLNLNPYVNALKSFEI